MMIVRSLSVSCVAARRTSLVLLALVVLMAFGASGREWTSCGLGVLELWPSVGCLSPSLTYRFLTKSCSVNGEGALTQGPTIGHGKPGCITTSGH